MTTINYYKIKSYYSFIKDNKIHSMMCTVCNDGIQLTIDKNNTDVVHPSRVIALEEAISKNNTLQDKVFGLDMKIKETITPEGSKYELINER